VATWWGANSDSQPASALAGSALFYGQCVCVCVCARERERKREKERVGGGGEERKREREATRERQRERERERLLVTHVTTDHKLNHSSRLVVPLQD
jgi:hypothetical protein